jgi:hypothetical protein
MAVSSTDVGARGPSRPAPHGATGDPFERNWRET